VQPTEEEHPRAQQIRESVQTSSFRRPVVEPAAPQPIGLDAGHAIRPTMSAAQTRPQPLGSVSDLVCNGAVALFALGAALAAGRWRRHLKPSPTLGAQVLQLARPAVEHRRTSRAA